MKKDWKKINATLLLCAFISFNNLSCTALAQEQVQQPAAESQSQNTIYKGSVQSTIEHLPNYRKTEIDTVNISANKATINKGNVIKIAFAQHFSTKTAKKGDRITFVLKESLKTIENRVLLPEGTKIIGTVEEVIPSKIWNRNAQALISLNDVILPDGTTGTLSAKVHAKNAMLKRSGWAATGKAALWTVGLFGVGAGVGAAIGAAASAVGTGCLAIGMPVGGGVGLITGSLTKGLNYKAKPGKTIYIELTEDLDISY